MASPPARVFRAGDGGSWHILTEVQMLEVNGIDNGVGSRGVIKSVFAAWTIVLGNLLLYDTPSAQVDLTKALVGTWQGEVHFFAMEPRRTLAIHYVIEQDGKWVAEGVYGITGKPLAPVQIDIDRSGPRPVLRFVTGASSRVRLDLFDEKNLVGTMALIGAGRAGSDNLEMKLGKLK